MITDIKVYETTDYSKFKKLEGNRPITDGRVDRIINSINKVGYITSPILVNEKMEIIDGQGRAIALERLRMPIQYIVREGIGIEECRQMNINQSNWTDYDFIASFAIKGDENYQRLQSLLDLFNLPQATVISSAMNLTSEGSGRSIKRIRNGRFTMSDKDKERARWELQYAEGFRAVAKNIGGNKHAFYNAVIFAYRNLDSAGRNRMEEVIRKHAIEIPSMSKVGGYLKYFDAYYNEGQRKNKHIYLAHQWEIDS